MSRSFKNGEILLIDKPLNWTSFDVVNKLRYALRKKYDQKRFKVGHAGTLDPLATGLLIICTGKATKKIEGLMGTAKSYVGTITFGSTTPSYDLETEADQHFDLSSLTEESISKAVEQLRGDIIQTPPIFSAKKKGGETAYNLARQGKEIKLDPVPVTVHSFELTKVELPDVDFDIEVSKGTYIRSIAHDLGKLAGNGAHLSRLRRTKVGEFSIEDALTIEEALEEIRSAEIETD